MSSKKSLSYKQKSRNPPPPPKKKQVGKKGGPEGRRTPGEKGERGGKEKNPLPTKKKKRGEVRCRSGGRNNKGVPEREGAFKGAEEREKANAKGTEGGFGKERESPEGEPVFQRKEKPRPAERQRKKNERGGKETSSSTSPWVRKRKSNRKGMEKDHTEKKKKNAWGKEQVSRRSFLVRKKLRRFGKKNAFGGKTTGPHQKEVALRAGGVQPPQQGI